MKEKLLLLIVFSTLFFRCKDDNAILPSPAPCLYNCDTSKLQVVWQTPLGEDSSDYASLTSILFNNKVLFTKMFGGKHKVVNCWDAKTGQHLWSWENPTDIPDGVPNEKQ